MAVGLSAKRDARPPGVGTVTLPPHAWGVTLGPARWHFQHGPIDLVIGVEGDPQSVQAALMRARQRFATLLAELVAELPILRTAVSATGPQPHGDVARAMWQATAALVLEPCPNIAGRLPTGVQFITPMAAVAGAVADTMVACFDAPGIERAWVNNGGDIALRLVAGTALNVALCADPLRRVAGRNGAVERVTVQADSPVRGIATSGWQGRSFSLGIADAVTVLARHGAAADAAATLIANAVNVEHPAIIRATASSLKDDTDLGDRLVTVHVPPLPAALLDAALDAGAAVAQALMAQGHVEAAWLHAQGRSRTCGGAGASVKSLAN